MLAGEKAFNKTGEWCAPPPPGSAFSAPLTPRLPRLPAATLDAFRKQLVGIKGPLTTPVGGGIRSLNVALRQELDLYVCLRPVRWFTGVPSPVKAPQLVDMVIFRENCEDIYAGIEWQAGSPEALKLATFLKTEFPEKFKKIRFPNTSGFGLKPVSKEGTERLVESALDYCLAHSRKSLTLVHKGNIMKSTEGAFRDWGYGVAASPKFRAKCVTERESWILGNLDKTPGMSAEANAKSIEPGYGLMTADKQKALRAEVEGVVAALTATHGGGKWKKMLLVKDAIADITLQQVLTRPAEFDVIATLNLNGDYLSDALAAQVGGIGIAPGGNINYRTGHAIFEARPPFVCTQRD